MELEIGNGLVFDETTFLNALRKINLEDSLKVLMEMLANYNEGIKAKDSENTRGINADWADILSIFLMENPDLALAFSSKYVEK